MSGFKSVCLWIFFVLISFCLANAANDSSYDFDALISEFKNLKESSDYCIEHYENGVCKALRFCDGQQSKSKKGKTKICQVRPCHVLMVRFKFIFRSLFIIQALKA